MAAPTAHPSDKTLQSYGLGKLDDLEAAKRDGSDIVKLGGPADVRAIFTRARHFDFGPPYRGRPVGR